MNEKTKVCVYIDKKLNERFKKRYPLMLSRYVEKCIKDGLKDDKRILDSMKNDTVINIFNRGLK